jgi:hypothetical protein
MSLIERPHRLLTPFAAALVLLAGLYASLAAPAHASTTQISIIEPGPHLNSDPVGTLHTLRLLGVDEIRLNMSWDTIAPDPTSYKAPKHFKASNPAAYPAGNWAIYDAIISDAEADGIGVDLDLSGRAPLWAMPGHQSKNGQGSYEPSASDYQGFAEAVGKRYSGTYRPSGSSTPLPDVTFWSVWNEANYTASLKPQATGRNGSTLVSPRIYRGLLDAAWSALSSTGHRHDKIVIGELTPRGNPDVAGGGMYPLVFLQALYCLDSHYHKLRGGAAAALGCPKGGGSRRFSAQNPALFDAAGVSLHPYSRWYPPNVEKYSSCRTGLCASLGDVSDLTKAITKVQHAYGSNRQLPVYSTEYGYQTSPPKPSYSTKDKAFNVSLATAAQYLNWAEYISYKNPQIASYDQYLLYDPASTKLNNFDPYASGLITWNGHYKPTFYAFRLPLYLPKTTASSSSQYLEVWGDVRPAHFASLDTGGTPQTVEVQFEPKGSSTFANVASEPITNSQGYFDTHLPFASSGTVRLAYTYPATDMLLAPGYTVFSRSVAVTVR